MRPVAVVGRGLGIAREIVVILRARRACVGTALRRRTTAVSRSAPAPSTPPRRRRSATSRDGGPRPGAGVGIAARLATLEALARGDRSDRIGVDRPLLHVGRRRTASRSASCRSGSAFPARGPAANRWRPIVAVAVGRLGRICRKRRRRAGGALGVAALPLASARSCRRQLPLVELAVDASAASPSKRPWPAAPSSAGDRTTSSSTSLNSGSSFAASGLCLSPSWSAASQLLVVGIRPSSSARPRPPRTCRAATG